MFDWEKNGVSIVVGVLSTLLATGSVSVFTWLILQTRFNKNFRQAVQHLRIAEALQREHQYAQAKEELSKTLSLLNDEQRSLLLCQAHLRLGDISMSLKEWDEAVRHFIIYREIARNTRHGTSEDVILLRLGKAYYAAGKPEDALRCFDDARRMQEAISNYPLLGETYYRLGEIETSLQHPEIAIGYYSRALSCHEKVGDRRTLATTRFCLGDLNSKLAHKDQALSQYSTAREAFNELGDFPFVAMLDDRIAQLKEAGTSA
jgi:tetratricopeptide (TPR) repeat protein